MSTNTTNTPKFSCSRARQTIPEYLASDDDDDVPGKDNEKKDKPKKKKRSDGEEPKKKRKFSVALTSLKRS